jgi:hypothetical protein
MKSSLSVLENRIKNGAFTRRLRWVLYYYPLSFSGSILFILSVVLLGRSYAGGNPYGVLLSVFAVTALFVLSAAGRLQAVRLRDTPPQWESSTRLFAEDDKTCQIFHAGGIKTFFFFRVHVSGRITIGRGASLFISGEEATSGRDLVEVPLFFPVAGEFNAKSSCKVRDIFGLTRARFGIDQERKLIVQPAPFTGKSSGRFEAVGGYEEKNRMKSSDEERYYMREYIPGDRFRDINWKSSSRLSELITKISPYTQEKTKTILIDFRHFKSTAGESPESIAHLNQLKSWLLFFLRQVKSENPEYIFRVKTGSEVDELETFEDIDRFSVELSTVFFQPEPSSGQTEPGISNVFIFSTPFDSHLHRVIARYQKSSVCVFRTVPGNAAGGSIISGRTVSGVRPYGEDKSGNIKNGRGKTFHLLKSSANNPAHIPVPDFWILWRDRFSGNNGGRHPLNCRFEDYPVSVRIF